MGGLSQPFFADVPYPAPQMMFANLYQHCAESLPGRIKMVMLNSMRFPYMCMAPCGCNVTGVPDGSEGEKVPTIPGNLADHPDPSKAQICPTEIMEHW